MEDAVADMAEIARTATTFQLYYDQNLPGPVAQAMLTALNTILSNSTYTPEEACDAIQAAMVQYEMHVKKALEAIPGVESAVASHEKGNAVVTLTSPVDDAALRKAVEEAGYKVVE